jgi:hypothetical protein
MDEHLDIGKMCGVQEADKDFVGALGVSIRTWLK